MDSQQVPVDKGFELSFNVSGSCYRKKMSLKLGTTGDCGDIRKCS